MFVHVLFADRKHPHSHERFTWRKQNAHFTHESHFSGLLKHNNIATVFTWIKEYSAK